MDSNTSTLWNHILKIPLLKEQLVFLMFRKVLASPFSQSSCQLMLEVLLHAICLSSNRILFYFFFVKDGNIKIQNFTSDERRVIKIAYGEIKPGKFNIWWGEESSVPHNFSHFFFFFKSPFVLLCLISSWNEIWVKTPLRMNRFFKRSCLWTLLIQKCFGSKKLESVFWLHHEDSCLCFKIH